MAKLINKGVVKMEFEKKTLNYSEEDMAEKNKENVSLFYNDALYLGYGKYDYNI